RRRRRPRCPMSRPRGVDSVYVPVDTVYMDLSDASRTLAGVLVLGLVTVETGGALMFRNVSGRHEATPLQRPYFRAGHAPAVVFLVLGLVVQLLVHSPTPDRPPASGAQPLTPIA